MAPNIPIEIIIHIIDRIPLDIDSKKDRLSLSKCSTVSRAFKTPCQSRLFSNIRLISFNGPARCRSLLTTLTRSPHLARLIRSLDIQNGWMKVKRLDGTQKTMWTLAEPAFPPVLDLLSALESIQLRSSTVRAFRWNIIGEAIQTSLLRLFELPSLTKICLRNVIIPPTVFARSPQLAYFGLHKSAIDLSQDLSHHTQEIHHPHLQTLHISSQMACVVWGDLRAFLDLSQLEELVLEDADAKGLDVVAAIFEKNEQSLVRFTWILPIMSEYFFSNIPWVSEFPLPARVRSMDLSILDAKAYEQRDMATPSTLTWVLYALRKLGSLPRRPELEHVVMRLVFEPSHHYHLFTHPIWEELDVTLAGDGDNFRSLRRFELFLSNAHSCAEDILDHWVATMTERPGFSWCIVRESQSRPWAQQ
ncbi:hypothetical protein H0H81_010750 [Sphagnurus paluster]|uniref:F-box domain-containing protein n=1 Tax=Sphagnurus paluster TaxID=117069 RepID=A0A9P7GLT0_9AGAR|nr:hypothetical protein H0H81_010750 [Sphagnurus paluster]